MNINPNLRNPLALFALCFLVVESIFTTLFMWRVENFNLCPCMVKMLLIFIIAFPSAVFIAFILIMLLKPEALYSRYENALADFLTNGMDKKEKQEHHMAKAVQYGEKYDAMPKIGAVNTSEEEILDKYISLNAPFLQKNIKVETKNGPRYFDAYAYWNGCHYVAEVKRLHKWTPSRVQGVRIFSTNARGCFSFLHMTLVLCITNPYDKEKIAKEIHEEDSSINVIFAFVESGEIKFSEIY